jgi:TonB family protein
MKKLLFLLSLTSFYMLSSAQDQIKIYFDKDWKVTQKEKAVFVREAEYDLQNFNLNGKVSDYTIDGNLVMEAHYVYGKKEGLFTFYINGIIQCQGTYCKDSRVGKWIYNYQDGQLRQSILFKDDNPDDFIVEEYYNKEGKAIIKNGTGKWVNDSIYNPKVNKLVRITGRYKNGLKVGLWKDVQLSNKRILATERYRKGNLKVYKAGTLKPYYKLKEVPSRMSARLQQERRSGISHEDLTGDASVRKVDDLPWIKGREEAISSVNEIKAPGTVTVLHDGYGTKYNVEQSVLADEYAGKINKLIRIDHPEETICKMPDPYRLKLDRSEMLILDNSTFPKSLLTADLETFFKTISPTPIRIAKRNAMFPKGNEILLSFIAQNLQYPVEEKEKKAKGTVFVNVTVDSSGYTKEVKVLKGIGENFDREAKQVLKKVRKWLPAVEDGKAIESTITIPIRFEI